MKALLVLFGYFSIIGVCMGQGNKEDDAQAVVLHAKRVAETLEYLGRPLSTEEKSKLQMAKTVAEVEAVLDAHALIVVTINPESRVKAAPGSAKPQLVEAGWEQFLVKVHNEAGVTAKLEVRSPQALPMSNSPKDKLDDRWMEIQVVRGRPVADTLSGTAVQYRILQLYSRDAGKRSAVLSFDVGQGTQDLGFRSDVMLTFDCRPSTEVTIRVLDENGVPTTAAFEFRDRANRVYPSQAKRRAPDFHFHPQIYRADGETVKLPAGKYRVKCTRGPEYLEQSREIEVNGRPSEEKFALERWIDPSKLGWWSGDHHIHAAGCAHYTKPSEGVHAPDMMRHCLGEDLKVGANLTWGPCFDYQKQFFTGKTDPVSRFPYILRYDVEVSGFGSHQSGHLCLLQLKQQIYPGGDSKHHWPKLCLNTLRWAKKQGGVCGPAHSGWGLKCESDQLPNYEIPPFDGIGANEYIVDVTHDVPGPDGKLVPAVDFVSTVDTPIVWELNIWYHTLNVGYRTRISGETDFPCIYGERVGLGRSYVKVDGRLSYDKWCQGIAKGRNYTGDGRSHLMDFNVGDVEVGTKGSELKLDAPGAVKVGAKVAAYLGEQPDAGLRDRHYTQKPYWHIERARVGDTRMVKVEVLVNGYPAGAKEIVADGILSDVEFEVDLKHSSWVAMRIYGSSHTNPVFVVVDGKPIRASKRSAEWCLKSVGQCWSQKERFIDADEMDDAKAAYAHAREAYRKRVVESVAD